MKKLIIGLIIAMVSFSCALAQEAKKVEINVNDLTPEQRAKYAPTNAVQVINNVDTDKWRGFGKEVGTAINETLSSLKENTVSFSQTGLGKLTVALIIWKVAGKDLMKIPIAVVWLIVVIVISLIGLRQVCKLADKAPDYYSAVPKHIGLILWAIGTGVFFIPFFFILFG